jgi:hypothetical protein
VIDGARADDRGGDRGVAAGSAASRCRVGRLPCDEFGCRRSFDVVLNRKRQQRRRNDVLRDRKQDGAGDRSQARLGTGAGRRGPEEGRVAGVRRLAATDGRPGSAGHTLDIGRDRTGADPGGHRRLCYGRGGRLSVLNPECNFRRGFIGSRRTRVLMSSSAGRADQSPSICSPTGRRTTRLRRRMTPPRERHPGGDGAGAAARDPEATGPPARRTDLSRCARLDRTGSR